MNQSFLSLLMLAAIQKENSEFKAAEKATRNYSTTFPKKFWQFTENEGKESEAIRHLKKEKRKRN